MFYSTKNAIFPGKNVQYVIDEITEHPLVSNIISTSYGHFKHDIVTHLEQQDFEAICRSLQTNTIPPKIYHEKLLTKKQHHPCIIKEVITSTPNRTLVLSYLLLESIKLGKEKIYKALLATYPDAMLPASLQRTLLNEHKETLFKLTFKNPHPYYLFISGSGFYDLGTHPQQYELAKNFYTIGQAEIKIDLPLIQLIFHCQKQHLGVIMHCLDVYFSMRNYANYLQDYNQVFDLAKKNLPKNLYLFLSQTYNKLPTSTEENMNIQNILEC